MLKDLKTLKWLSIRSYVTDAGLAALKEALPGAKIENVTLPTREVKPAPAAAGTQTAPRLASFKADLGDGSVRLVAVARHPPVAGAGAWWQPDGSRWTEGPFTKTYDGKGNPNLDLARYEQYDFIARTAGLPEGAEMIMFDVTPDKGSLISGGYGGPVEGPTEGPGIRLWEHVRIVPREARTGTVRMDVAMGPWKTLATGGRPGAAEAAADGPIKFSRPTEKDGAATVTVTHNVPKQLVRIVAIDVGGGEPHTDLRIRLEGRGRGPRGVDVPGRASVSGQGVPVPGPACRADRVQERGSRPEPRGPG